MPLVWEKPASPTTTVTRAFDDQRHVATVVRTRNHTATVKRVYSVDVLGGQLPRRYEHISDARAAAEAEYERRSAD
jgi:hypothetical protein